jgi:hypothetical protein
MDINIDDNVELPAWSASLKQRRFIRQLAQERLVDATVAENLRLLVVRDDFEKVDATKLISELIEMPKRSRAVPVLVTTPDGTVSTLATIDDLEVSRFAVPVTELSPGLVAVAGNSDLLFGEVREWKGHKFINALKGAPGDFNRIRIRGGERAELVKLLARDQYRYTKLYGKYYTCCGCCGADLTDEKSRSLQLGPDCRKRFGF